MNVQIKNITKKYGRRQILSDVSLDCTGGECIAVLGGNGCGKSTLLSILAGVRRRDGGEFTVNGKNLFSDPSLFPKTVAYVPQGTPLITELSARDNLLMWYDKASLEKELSDGVLAMLGIPDFYGIPVYKMSGGMKKRLSIGCAVANHPPILLLDEPGAALDLPCKKKISDYLIKCKKSGALVIIATHEISEIEICDRYFILKNGTLSPFDYDGNIGKLVNSL